MTAAMAPELLDRLAKVCGLFGSDHEGEVVAAARRAEAIVRAEGLTWRDVLLHPPATVAPEQPLDHAGIIAFCLLFPDLLTAWDRSFLEGCTRRLRSGRPLSPKQVAVLERLHTESKVVAAARAAA